jgi:macrodomain Ter protein organizer (MatP/YcbG family)
MAMAESYFYGYYAWCISRQVDRCQMKQDGVRKSIKVDAETWRWLALESVKNEIPIGEVVSQLVQSARRDRRSLLSRTKT